MSGEDLIQGSPEWIQFRCGRVSASNMDKLMAKTKGGGYGTGRQNYMADLIAERLTGVPTKTFQSDVMRWGIEQEPAAKDAYMFFRDTVVESVGFVEHPTIPMSGASPDGLVTADGLIEVKCPLTATHIDTLLSGDIETKYIQQMQWQLACTQRKWCDFVSFDPKLPPSMQLFVKRVPRDQSMIDTLEREVRQFIAELNTKIRELQAKYEAVAA